MGDLILLRHGETEWSLAGKHTGRTDIPLTPHGEAAAAALAPLLARRHIVAAFTSPARRAVTTAALAGLADAKPDPDLWEWDYGGYEGLTTAQIHQTRPGWYLWRDGVIPGDAEHPGETVEQVGERADRVLARSPRCWPTGRRAGRARRTCCACSPPATCASSRRPGGCSGWTPGRSARSAPSTTSRSSRPGTCRPRRSAARYRAKAPWAGRVSSRIQFRYAVEPATMGSAMISGSS